ncbi:MAG TPA: hypothetical protein VGP54_00115 [Gaiellaceae bacterium]|nr:hypothetical protein [Gaiellaceae bacterium]
MVEPDAPVLTGAAPRLRGGAFLVLAGAVVTWYLVAPHLSPVGLWPAVTIVAVGVLPATLGLILLALPLWSHRWIVAAGVAFGIAAVVTWEADSHLASNFAKLAAYTCAGWAFLRLFEELGWVVIVAAIIPFVDAISVAAGPTKHIVNHHFEVYSALAVAFLAPGGGAAFLGPPDILFYALFLAAAVRWRLRPVWTWVAMTGMYSLTLVLANATDVGGLPALPFLSAGFLLANGDLLWRRLRRRTA